MRERGVGVARLEMFYTDFSADLMTSWSIESCVCCVQHIHWTRRLLVYHFLLKRSFGMKSKEGLELEMLFKILKAFRRILLALRTFKDALFFSPHHHPIKMCAQRENKRVHHTYLYFLRPDLIWWLMEKCFSKCKKSKTARWFSRFSKVRLPFLLTVAN